MKTYEVKRCTLNNKLRNTIWVHRPFYKSMYWVIEQAQEDLKDKDKETGETWTIDTVRRVD